MAIRWEQRDSSAWYGYSGSLVVAMVVQPFDDNPERRWRWIVDGGRIPHGWVNYGERKDAASARRAADAYWQRWLELVGLVACDSKTASK